MTEKRTTTKSTKMKEDVKIEDNSKNSEDFRKLLEDNNFKVPTVGDLVKGSVIASSKAEVKIDIEGILTGVVRGPELYEEDDEYANLKPGDEVEATVIENENENGELELSFRYAGQEKAWAGLRDAYGHKKSIKVKVVDANKGGLLVKYRQIPGFLPVSQLAPENYPRINGGDKGKILEKLKSFIGKEFEVKVMAIEEREEKIIYSEKEAWNEKQRDVISKYRVGKIVEGVITAITNFGVFISFGENLEGLIHISELAWQRIDDPADLFKVGEKIKAEVIGLENGKIFLSVKKLIKDPWQEVEKKYKIGQKVRGIILKINPFGLFVKLDEDIHGLAHISQLSLAPKQRINEKFKTGQKFDFEIVSLEPKDHRLGLAYSEKGVKSETPALVKDTASLKAKLENAAEIKTAGKKVSKENSSALQRNSGWEEKKAAEPKKKKVAAKKKLEKNISKKNKDKKEKVKK